jgi:hypothetical protein
LGQQNVENEKYASELRFFYLIKSKKFEAHTCLPQNIQNTGKYTHYKQDLKHKSNFTDSLPRIDLNTPSLNILLTVL